MRKLSVLLFAGLLLSPLAVGAAVQADIPDTNPTSRLEFEVTPTATKLGPTITFKTQAWDPVAQQPVPTAYASIVTIGPRRPNNHGPADIAHALYASDAILVPLTGVAGAPAKTTIRLTPAERRLLVRAAHRRHTNLLVYATVAGQPTNPSFGAISRSATKMLALK